MSWSKRTFIKAFCGKCPEHRTFGALNDTNRRANDANLSLNDTNLSLNDTNLTLNDANRSLNDTNLTLNDANRSLNDANLTLTDAKKNKYRRITVEMTWGETAAT